MARLPTKAEKDKARRETPAERQARHEADHAAIERVASKPAKAAKAAPAPTPAPAPIASPVALPAPAVTRHTVPVGVYLNRNRNTAIVIKHSDTGLWYLTMLTGQITLEHCSEQKFAYDWRIGMPDYPMRRAIRLYEEGHQVRDERTQKVMRVLLRDL